jgi:hypothetical protein
VSPLIIGANFTPLLTYVSAKLSRSQLQRHLRREQQIWPKNYLSGNFIIYCSTPGLIFVSKASSVILTPTPSRSRRAPTGRPRIGRKRLRRCWSDCATRQPISTGCVILATRNAGGLPSTLTVMKSTSFQSSLPATFSARRKRLLKLPPESIWVKCSNVEGSTFTAAFQNQFSPPLANAL